MISNQLQRLEIKEPELLMKPTEELKTGQKAGACRPLTTKEVVKSPVKGVEEKGIRSEAIIVQKEGTIKGEEAEENPYTNLEGT